MIKQVRLLRRHILFVVTAAFLGAVCGDDPRYERPDVDTTDTRSKELMTLAEELPTLQRFRYALRATGLSQELREPGPFTLFAPIDAGFLQSAGAESVLVPQQRDTLEKIVRLHVVRGSIERVWGDSLVVLSMADEEVTLRRTPRGMEYENQPILRSFQVQNGMLHIISSTISHPEADTTQELIADTLAEGLEGTAGPGDL